METKGQSGYVIIVVGLVFAIVLFTALAFPQIRTMTAAQTTNEVLATHTKGTNQSVTLTNTDMVNGGLSISGLTVTANYTINYTSAVLTINDTTLNGTYTATYSYLAAGYITNTGTRSFAAVLVLFLIVGLTAGALKMFGVL